jgi:hypothetical protein
MADLQAQQAGPAHRGLLGFVIPVDDAWLFLGKAMDVSFWLAWSLVLIPVAAVFTVVVLIRDERRVKRALKDRR